MFSRQPDAMQDLGRNRILLQRAATQVGGETNLEQGAPVTAKKEHVESHLLARADHSWRKNIKKFQRDQVKKQEKGPRL